MYAVVQATPIHKVITDKPIIKVPGCPPIAEVMTGVITYMLTFDAEGRRYIRTGDVGRIDDDGFVVLMDRKKDMLISGGFNVYPSDLEAVLLQHPAVAEAAVVGVPSERWGESPVACVVPRAGATAAEAELMAWVNERVAKPQRLAGLRFAAALPRSEIGKVLKRELRERWLAEA